MRNKRKPPNKTWESWNESVCAFLINLLFHCCCYFQKVWGANGGKNNLIVKLKRIKWEGRLSQLPTCF